MVGERALQLIREFEGLRLRAYDDGTGVQSIGYGHTHGVSQGDTCTQEQAEAWLREDAAEAESAVRRLVTVPLSQSQIDALTSFVFNLGPNALERSTLLLKLNAGDYSGAAAEFSRWVFAGGKQLPGLVKRRESEAELFASGKTPPVAKKESIMPIPAILAALLPVLANAVPELAKIIKPGSESAEKNAAVATKVFEVAQQALGATNAQQVAEQVQSDPKAAQIVRDAVREQWFTLSDLMQVHEADESSRVAAADRNIALSKETGGRWLWLVGAVAATIIVASYGIVWLVLTRDSFSDETRALLLGQVVILGFGTVVSFLFGSSLTSKVSQMRREQ